MNKPEPHAAKNAGGDLMFLPLGGAGEVGLNCNLYGYGTEKTREWLMVDLGVGFGDYRTPGVDLVLPDIGYIVKQKARLKALILTHGHEDHIGAVAHLWPYLDCPIYASPFTSALVRDKFRQKGLCADGALRALPRDRKLTLGAFQLQFYGFTHSIPEMQAIALRTPAGMVLHTGDWKLDPQPLVGEASDLAGLRRLGKQGVAVLVCDSTNALTEGEAGSEKRVRAGLTAAIKGCAGRVVMTGFASNVARLESMAHAAAAHGRAVCLAGRGMHRIYQAARASGYLQDFPPLVSEEDAAHLPAAEVAILCTGSQGEPLAALNRLAQRRHRCLQLAAGDMVVFSSRIIPGNETAVLDLHNRLLALGATLKVAQAGDDLHVSGHPCRDELRRLYRWVRPRALIPVHGEERHLQAQRALALAEGVPHAVAARNGSLMRLAPGPPRVVRQVPHGRLHLDGEVMVRADESPALMRRALAQSGLVMLYVSIADVSIAAGAQPARKARRRVRAARRVCGAPILRCKGLPERDKMGEKLDAALLDAVRPLLDKPKAAPKDWKQALVRALARACKQRLGKVPEIEIVLNMIES